MLQMSVDTRAIERRLTSLAKSQLPFAVALGINDVTGQIAAAERTSMGRDLDRPTPFTQRGLTVDRASKRKLTGIVRFKPIQAEYLATQASGGKRRAKKRAVLVPVGLRVNKYGNLPKNAIKRALARPDTFSGKVRGVAGIYQRPKGGARRGRGGVGAGTNTKGLKLLVAYKASVSYAPRLKFVPRAHRLADREIGPAIAKRLRLAVQTAR